MFQLDFKSYVNQFADDKTKNNSSWPVVRSKINSSSDSEATKVRKLLQLGILYWRRGDFDRSEQLLTKVQEISMDTQDTSTLTQCFIGLGLVKTRLNKIDEAIEAYQHAIKLEPQNFHLWNNMGKLYIRKHHLDNALGIFKQSIHCNSNNAVAWNGLANAHYQMGNVDEAIRAYRHVIGLMKTDNLEQSTTLSSEWNNLLTHLWLRLAKLYTKKYQYQKAIDAYKNVLAYDNGNPAIWNELGILYIKVETFENSMDAFSKAIELNPDFGEAYLNLAYAYTKVGDYQASIPLFMKSIERLPSQRERKFASHLMEEAVRIVKENDAIKIYLEPDETRLASSYRDEISWFYYKYNDEITIINLPCSAYDAKKLTKKTSDKIAHRKRTDAKETYRTNKTTEGEGYLSSIKHPSPLKQIRSNSSDMSDRIQQIKTERSDPYVWNEKGNMLFNSQDYVGAATLYKRAIDCDPSFGQPYHNLALIHFIRGDYDQAIPLYQESIKLLKTDQEKAIAWNGLGHVYRCIKDYESARFAYQRASELDKKNGGVNDNKVTFEINEQHKTVSFWNELGKLLFKLGAYEKATSAFQKAIEIDPYSGHALSHLARAFTAQGRYKEAVSLFRKSIDLFSNDNEKAKAWNRLGDVHRKLNDYDNALLAYKNAMALTNDNSSLLSRTRFSLLSNCATKQ